MVRVMTHKNKQTKKKDKLPEEVVSGLAKIFELLFQMDERNKREGKYNEAEK